jgi:hypothetical protein
MSSIYDRLLMHRRGTRLLASDKPGADPHGLSAISQVGREAPTVVYGTGTDDQDGSTGQRGCLSFDFVHDGGDQDRRGHVARMSPSFTGLSADEVDADLKGFGNVLGMTDHLINSENAVSVGCIGAKIRETGGGVGLFHTYVHDENSCGVEFLDYPLGRNADCRYEKDCLLLYIQK